MNWVDKIYRGVYTASIHVYQGLLRVASLRVPKARTMLQGRTHSLQSLRSALPEHSRPIWLHAASLGEFEQGRPLLERVRAAYPHLPIVLSFYSPSGYEVRKGWGGADAVVYLPPDTVRAMRRFIDVMQPRMAIFVKYEFWANALLELHRRHIPIYLISAVFRPSQIFFKPWGGWWRSLLQVYTGVYVQDEGSRSLLHGAGRTDAVVAGDTRFDRVCDVRDAGVDIPQIEALTRGGTRLCFMAGSSWPADEQVYLPWLRSRAGSIKAVIAPHEFDAERLERMRRACGPELKVVLLSEARANEALIASADVLIIDCFGLLSSAYRYADIAYVGGGFGAGIHNINEAAVYGIPVVFGPRCQKFIEARELQQAGGGYCIHSEAECGRLLDTLCDDTATRAAASRAAEEYIASKTGASDLIFGDIEKGLKC